MQTTQLLKKVSLCGLLLAGSIIVTQAQSVTVTNTGAGQSLNIGSEWLGSSGNGVPTSANIAVWNSVDQTDLTESLGASSSWAGIQILNPGGPITVSAGNTLTLGAWGIDLSQAIEGLALACPVVLGAPQSWNVATGQALTNSGVISGSSQLVLNFGANYGGTVVLGAANTFSGNVIISNGIVEPNSSGSAYSGTVGSFGAANTPNLISINGVTLEMANFASSGIVPNNFNVTGTNVVDMASRGISIVLDGAFSGNGTIYVSNEVSGSTMTFGGNGYGNGGQGNWNSFTGSLIVVSNNVTQALPAGTIRFNNGGSSANLGNVGMILNLGPGTTSFAEKNNLQVTSFGALYGGTGTLLAQQEYYHVGALNLPTDTFSGASTGAASTFTKDGTGQFIWNNTVANSYTGVTTVNGGILQIGDGVTTAAGLLGNGSIVVNPAGKLTFNRPDDFSIVNAISGSGTLIKANTDNLTCSGTISMPSGSVQVNQGTLSLDVAGVINAPVTLASGTTYNVAANTSFTMITPLTGSGMVAGMLTAASGSTINPGGSGAAGTLTFSGGLTEQGGVINEFTPGASELISVTGPLTLNNTNNVALQGTFGNGTYPFIAYSGGLTGDITNFSVASGSYTATLTNITSTTPPEIAVIITPAVRGATNLTWKGDGINNTWDTTSTGDWVNGANSFIFQGGDRVLFSDSGAPNTNVNVAVTVVPGSLTVSNTIQYFLAGNGTINGTEGLTKTNSGILSILATNSYTGPTVVGGGTLEAFNVADGGLPSAIGAAGNDPSNLVFYGSVFKYSGVSSETSRGATLNGAGVTVDVANSVILTNNGTLAGPGALTLIDTGTLMLGGVSTYNGGTVLSNGVLAAASVMGDTSGFGSGAINFHGGTLTMYNSTYDDSVTVCNFTNALNVPAGQTGTINTPERGVVGSTLTGSGTLNVISIGPRCGFGGDWSAFTGTINLIYNGTADTYFRIDNSLGYSNAVMNLQDYSDLDGGGSGGVYSTAVTFDIGELDGTSLATLGSSSASKCTEFPTWRVGWKNTTSSFAGVIANPTYAASVFGVAAITKVGTGSWFLSGQNTFTGPTTVTSGVLSLTNMGNGNGSINDSTNIYINAGAVLDVTGLSPATLYLQANQVLCGDGTFYGNLDNTAGGIVSGGTGIDPTVGTLTVTNSINLGGSGLAWMKLNRTASPDSDRLVSSLSTITYGGTLVVTNIGPRLQRNDTFTLFSGGGLSGGTFNTIILPNYYTWNTGSLGANGQISVASVLPPPAISGVDFSQLSSGTITLNAVNGAANGPVNVLTTTDLALPVSSWTVAASTTFTAGGTLNLQVTVDPTQPQSYFMLQAY